MFELWADKVKILGAQDLISCLVSFFELCFSFQLRYGKGAQITCEIIQRKVAEYGVDGSGTLTNKPKDTVNRQVKKYQNFLKIHNIV